MSKLSRMNTVVNKLADAPFKYGKNDCYTFTAGLVKEWHGKDYTKLHSVYKNKLSAGAYIEEHGGIEKLTIGTLGYSCEPTLCKNGDVVTAEVSKGEVALGFVFDCHGLFKSKTRLVKIPLDKCRMGWRIK